MKTPVGLEYRGAMHYYSTDSLKLQLRSLHSRDQAIEAETKRISKIIEGLQRLDDELHPVQTKPLRSKKTDRKSNLPKALASTVQQGGSELLPSVLQNILQKRARRTRPSM
jgi:hypothetical protein